MNAILSDRLTVARKQGLVVFLIGMRINSWWKIHRWLPVALAMPRMLRELKARPDSGYLGGMFLPGMSIQYWESTEKLLAYAHDRKGEHYPAWSRFQRAVGTDGSVGIWHETYVVPDHGFECIYVNMPRFGLGKIFDLVPAQGKHATATRRLRAEPSDAPSHDSAAATASSGSEAQATPRASRATSEERLARAG